MKLLEKINKNKYLLISIAIFLVAVASRFILLYDRPLHHDEGMLSYFAWRFSHFGDYTYTPQIHAPILFYVQGLLYLAFGVRDVVSRVGPAIFGVLLVMLPLFFHKLLSKKVAVFISVGFLISPIFLYYSRFLVHTTIAVVFWLLFVLLTRNYFRSQSPINLYFAFASLALAFATSETSYIFVAILAIYAVALFVIQREGFRKLWIIFLKNYLDFITGALIFILVWSLFYSVGFTNPESLRRSLPILSDESTGLGFWLAQHPKRLGGQPWHYYLILSLVYELVFTVGSLGFIFKFFSQKKTCFKVFVVVWLLGTLGVYSWAGEKFPWLFLPSLLAMVVATGIYLGENWHGLKVIAKLAFVVLALWIIFVAIRLAYFSPENTNELAVYVQTPNSFQERIDEITEDCQNSPDANCVLVDQKVSWPLSWSFRNISTLIVTDNYSVQPSTKYLIVGSDALASLKEPEGMTRETLQIRSWWVPDKCRQINCVEKFLKYFVSRETWNEKGGYEVYIFSLDGST